MTEPVAQETTEADETGAQVEARLEKLERDLSRKTREVRIIQAIASELNALDLDAILEAILRSMDEVFGFRHAMVLLADEEAGVLRVAASHGYSEPGIGATVRIGQGVVGVVASRRKLMRVGNLAIQVGYASAVRARTVASNQGDGLGDVVRMPGLPNAQSQVAIPLVVKDVLVGVFSVESERASVFDERDEQLIGIIASQAASAIHNARLYRSAEERRRALDVANEQLRSLNETLEDKVHERTLELARTQARLVQSEKMASLAGLVAGIAHEMNTPLGAMTSTQVTLKRALARLDDLLREESPEIHARHSPLVARVTAGMDVLTYATERVADIVRRLRSFARLDEAQRKIVSVHEGLDDTLGVLARQLEGATIVRSYGDVPPIACSPASLNQVFLNVIQNAREALPPSGGTITVTTSADEQRVLVVIEDDGRGIAPEDLPRVFDPGFTTKGVGVGAGLGLATCYAILRDHGGDITLEPLARGTRALIHLPLGTGST
ncbi:MAG: GAF domain-containing protein [Deltaproteobacteria bacterium]|nr:GAF domain-containing protein [Deltaproteobacteria bacterium]